MNKPIFILGCHKSGTTLVRNLLDGSPGTFAIPIETHFFSHIGLGVAYELAYTLPKRLKFDEVAHRLCMEIKESNDKPSSQMKWGDSFIPGSWNIDAFYSYLYKTGKPFFDAYDLRAFFNCFVQAMYLSLFGEIPSDNIKFVEKSVENAEFVPVIQNLYPDAKFVHVVRNPYATLVALRRFKYVVGGHYPFIAPLLQSMENSYYYLYKNQLHINNYLVVRFEDLLTNPPEVMKKIATFCGIVINEILLKPSFLIGKDWLGNSMSGKDFKGISTHPIHSWIDEINELEIRMVNLLFPHILRDYQYDKVGNAKYPLLRFKGESMPNYIANRFYAKSTAYIREVNRDIQQKRYAKYRADFPKPAVQSPTIQ